VEAQLNARARALGLLFSLIGSVAAMANPIQLDPTSIATYRLTRSPNDINFVEGDRVLFSANIVGGATGSYIGAQYPATGYTVPYALCGGTSTANPNACARTDTFDSSRLSPWTLLFANGVDRASATGPSLIGAEQPVPFPVSVSLAGPGSLTPTISWQIPSGFTPDAIRISIYDKNRVAPNGGVDTVHRASVAPTAGTYTLPSLLSTGLTLQVGGHYTIGLELYETRGHVALTQTSQVLRRSDSYFAFSPLSGNSPPNVFLPTVSNGTYSFAIASVGPNSITYIDPDVAVGYDYAIGAGDPNFASVLLPDVGDGQFTLQYTADGGTVNKSLSKGVQFFFPQGGVSSFHVGGIETSAGLDPGSATAFITGLTFAGAGAFTGTMTPITVFVPEVPEPAVWQGLVWGLLVVCGSARVRRRGLLTEPLQA
jgi:hypothetical protein